ncbi:restriction endonuclease subunit S [Leucothrix mucor]|uniref:restriction endonuclease subunit S n=1 Tax=Leucothrix mucor TaxID=45248 RepID=UPI0003B7594B|nr:restriction endonuclease subunit S [Leucothrix mucor]
MADRYQAYPEYKESSVEFIGSTPVSWGVTKFKYAINFQEGPGILAKDFFESGVPLLRIQNVKEEFVSDDYKTYLDKGTVEQKWKQFKVRLGDIIMSCSASTGIVSEVDSRTVGAIPYTGLIRLWPKLGHMNKDFIKYFVQSEVYVKQIEVLQTGATIQHYGPIHLNQISISMPEEIEQQKIANFLDHETAKIDTLIEKQQQLIKLLKEKRQAVISHAVIKGLNPDAPMRDSGVEWLGEVPEHWDCCLIKHMCAEITDGAHISPDTEGGEHFFVSITDIKKGKINFDNALLTTGTSYRYLVKAGCLPFPGDILFSKDGTIGQTAITPEGIDFVVASSLIIIRPNRKKVQPSYLDFLLQSGVVAEQVESFVKGAALRRLSIQNLLKVVGTFPPIDEQIEISDYLNLQLGEYDELDHKANILISFLKERRTALISAAVTGKIDVRDWQAPALSSNPKKEAVA